MEQTSRILLLLSFSAAFAKYVYIPEMKTWHQAQEYCRKYHTDLAPVSSTYDIERLQQISGNVSTYMWIGLERNCMDRNKWMWSGGRKVSTSFWAIGQPDNTKLENFGLMFDYSWHDAERGLEIPFLCYNAVVVREKKTWEQALAHCREHHQDLASVASDTEMLLIQKQLSNQKDAEPVWIGLRFLPGGWLWVDGQPLDYEAWGQEGKLQCPGFKQRCGALRGTGGTQGKSTHEFPSVNAGWMDYLLEEKTCWLNTAADNVKVGEWEARDCVEKRYFICY